MVLRDLDNLVNFADFSLACDYSDQNLGQVQPHAHGAVTVRTYSGDIIFSNHLESGNKDLQANKGYLDLCLSFSFDMVFFMAFS